MTERLQNTRECLFHVRQLISGSGIGGSNPMKKITTVAGLLEKYNFDMAAFLIAE